MSNLKTFKKLMSVLLAVSVIMSCMVFAMPVQTNAASAGSYKVTVNYNVGNKADKQGNIQEGTWTVTYNSINGTGSSGTYTYDYKSNYSSTMSSTGSKSISFDVPGFPTKLDYKHDAVWNDTVTYTMSSIKIGSTTLWSGSKKIKSGGIGNSVASGSLTLSATKPYASSMTASYASSSKTCPSTSSSSATTNVLTYGATDQYGVVMDSSLCTVTVKGSSSGTTGISTSGSSGTATTSCTYSANISGTTDSQTVTATCTWKGSSSKSTTATFTLNDYTGYSVKYMNYGGDSTFYTESGITYGHTATGPSSTPVRAFDTDYHYTFSGWNGTLTNITATKTVTATFNSVAHSYTKEVIKAATCTEGGTDKYTCSCGYSYTSDTPALDHDKQVIEVAPTDQTAGYIYYKCSRCDTVWTAVVNDNTGTLEPATEPSASVEEVIQNTDPVPAPSFNTYSDPAINYDYSNRGAGLKLDDITYTDQNTVQNTRFTGSMLVPTGIDYSFASTNNSVTDFGFVYSQSELIDYDISNLEYGKNKVYKMSVSAQNSGTFNGTNWTGVSTHSSLDGTYLTFNLLIGIKAKNWSKDYCARAYITYNYMGFTYTVYDQDFSSRSVQFIAEAVVGNESESEFARNYCQTKILDHIA